MPPNQSEHFPIALGLDPLLTEVPGKMRRSPSILWAMYGSEDGVSLASRRSQRREEAQESEGVLKLRSVQTS